MKDYTFFEFVKWHFKLSTDMFFVEPDERKRGTIGKNERLPLIIIAYLVFVCSCSLLFLQINGIVWLFALIMIIPVTSSFVTRFSILYYILLYAKYKTLSRSINDKAIVSEFVLYKTEKSVWSTISKYHKIAYTTGNIFCLKYVLRDRSDKKSSKKFYILKITPRKIILNHKVISTKKILEITELDELLKNNQIKK